MTPSLKPSETESSPFVPSTEGEIANAFVLYGMMLREIQKEQEAEQDETE